MRDYLKAKRIPIVLMVLAALTVILVKCAVNPVTGKKEIMLISENMEIGMGRDIDRALKMEYGLYQDAQMRAYVAGVGQAMAPHTHRPHLQYHFAILDTPVENAFAAPGGYIYITRGLMAMLNSEAELATVLGHELGHVNARHSARQMTRSILVTLGILIAGELSEDIRKITPVSMVAAQLLFLKYSRKDEYQADELGIQYATKINYSAGEMVNFFSSLQRLTASHGGGGIPNFLSTHPLTPRRVERIKELLASEEYRQPEGAPRPRVARNTYLQKMDGIVYGMNPRQGFVEGNYFYHPDMQFAFAIPRGWKVGNTARQVTMVSPDEKAIMILQTEDTTESLDGYSRKMMKTLTNPQVLQQGFGNVNGLNAYHSLLGVVTASDESEEAKKSEDLNVRLSCIRKGGTVFSFFSAASLSDFSRHRYEIDGTVNSFNRLRSTRHLNRKPRRVLVKRVKRARTLRNFLGNWRINKKHWNKIALINGMELNDRLSPSQLIKMIR